MLRAEFERSGEKIGTNGNLRDEWGGQQVFFIFM
jgi:hypothetical protein